MCRCAILCNHNIDQPWHGKFKDVTHCDTEDLLLVPVVVNLFSPNNSIPWYRAKPGTRAAWKAPRARACREPTSKVGIQSPHRIFTIGWLLFMRCVPFTLTGLFLRWTPVETFETLLAKLLSGCDSATCLTKCKARHSKICEILKKTCHFEAAWIFSLVIY